MRRTDGYELKSKPIRLRTKRYHVGELRRAMTNLYRKTLTSRARPSSNRAKNEQTLLSASSSVSVWGRCELTGLGTVPLRYLTIQFYGDRDKFASNWAAIKYRLTGYFQI